MDIISKTQLNEWRFVGHKPYFCKTDQSNTGPSLLMTPNILCYYFLFFFLLLSKLVNSQDNVITVGVQYKPIFSSNFFNTGPEIATANGVNFEIAPKSGFCAGVIIRKGFTKTVSFESGINYVKRNFNLKITDSDFTGDSEFSIVGYEIPVLGLIFIQLSDQIFMDVALGLSLDFYASDVRTNDYYFNHYSAYQSWFSPAVLANLGWEYRTEKSGYFYLGASYHRPFKSIYKSFVEYTPKPEPDAIMDLQGNYLTMDVRYFFHSDPQKRKKKTSKPNPKAK